MKTWLFLPAVVLVLAGSLNGQTAAPEAPPSTPMDPARVAEFQKRFQAGYALEKAGQLAEARAAYDAILAEQPEAKRSLLEAGRVSLELNEPLKAEAYLDKLHALVPTFPEAIELLIQSSEAMKHEVKAERLVREFRALRDAGTVPGFSDSLYFDRERVKLDAGTEIVISQFFDFTKPPYCSLKAELYDAQRKGERVLWLKYDPDGTKALQAKDPKLSRDQIFILAEPHYTGTQLTTVDVYQQLLSTPDYVKARAMLLLIFVTAPKPIYSAPVTAASD